MNKINKKLTFACFTLVVFVLLAIIIINGLFNNKTELEVVQNFVKSYYDNVIARDYHKAVEMLQFTESTIAYREIIPASYEGAPLKYYSIKELKKLDDDIYQVEIDGVFEVNGVEHPVTGLKYAIFNNNEWKYCLSNRFVPPEIYKFSNNQLHNPLPDGGEVILLPQPNENGEISIE